MSSVSSYISASMECMTILVIMAGLEKKRCPTHRMKVLLFGMIYMLYYVVMKELQLPPESAYIGYVMLFFYLKIAYHETNSHTLLVLVVSIVMTIIAEFLILCGVFAFVPEAGQVGIVEVLASGLTTVVSIFIYRSRQYRLVEFLEKREITYVVVGLLTLMVFVPTFVMRMGQQINLLDYFYIFVCVFAMWFLMFRLQKYKIESRVRKEYFEGYKEVIAQIRLRQHKIKNHIDIVYRMHELYPTYEELVMKQKEYLTQVQDYELPNDAIILEEPTIIALIYGKMNEAMDRGIRVLTSFSSSMVNSRISDVLWVEIIGTLFDNAMEAVDMQEGEKKVWVEISSSDSGKLILRMMNTFPHKTNVEIQHFFKMGYSTKGEGRGLGLFHVKDIVEKHDGTIQAGSGVVEDESVMIFEITI